jgi:hypothetical protein
MKTKMITTFTAVAALIAGISIASAQMQSSPSSQSGPAKVTGNAAFCITTSDSGALNCKYQTMASCEKDAKSQNLNCSPNPSKSTTGSKQ